VPTFAPTRPLTPGPWCNAELSAWTPPQDLRPSQFAEQFRVLTRRQSSRPGPWRNDNAPPLAVIMDLCARRTVRELWIRKAAQLGVSEAIRNVIMYVAVREPDPLLIVLPNEQVGRKIVRKRLIPLFEDTECLAELATESARDKKLTAITLANGFDLQLAWSGSAAALASDPFRFVILDEVDKFEAYAGVEASPVDLARVRTRTYPGTGLIVGLSTPTVDSGPISVAYDDCPVKLDFYAPCPHCGRPQRLVEPG
jgi:phage terminase large subunit GpA-like protein